MPWLIFKDGRRGKVHYNKAATIYQLLQGNEVLDENKPDYKKKKEFLDTVAEVVFEDNKSAKGSRPWEQPEWWKKKRL